MLGRPAVQEHRLPLLLRRLDRMVETDELAVGGDYRVTIAQCDAVTGPAVVNIAEWPDLLRTFGSHAAALPMIGPTCRKRLSGDRLVAWLRPPSRARCQRADRKYGAATTILGWKDRPRLLRCRGRTRSPGQQPSQPRRRPALSRRQDGAQLLFPPDVDADLKLLSWRFSIRRCRTEWPPN